MAKAAVSLSGRDILDLSSLSVEEYDLIMKTAAEMKKILKRDIKKVPSSGENPLLTCFMKTARARVLRSNLLVNIWGRCHQYQYGH